MLFASALEGQQNARGGSQIDAGAARRLLDFLTLRQRFASAAAAACFCATGGIERGGEQDDDGGESDPAAHSVWPVDQLAPTSSGGAPNLLSPSQPPHKTHRSSIDSARLCAHIVLSCGSRSPVPAARMTMSALESGARVLAIDHFCLLPKHRARLVFVRHRRELCADPNGLCFKPTASKTNESSATAKIKRLAVIIIGRLWPRLGRRGICARLHGKPICG